MQSIEKKTISISLKGKYKRKSSTKASVNCETIENIISRDEKKKRRLEENEISIYATNNTLSDIFFGVDDPFEIDGTYIN
jgi:hypothetical protein